MNFLQRSILGSVAALRAVFLGAVLIGSVPAAAQTPDGTWTLLAVATDVDMAVFADATGALRKISIGEHVAGDAWRLTAIRDGRAVLKAEQRLDGRVVELRLAAGERVMPPPESQPSRAGANTGTR